MNEQQNYTLLSIITFMEIIDLLCLKFEIKLSDSSPTPIVLSEKNIDCLLSLPSSLDVINFELITTKEKCVISVVYSPCLESFFVDYTTKDATVSLRSYINNYSLYY